MKAHENGIYNSEKYQLSRKGRNEAPGNLQASLDSLHLNSVHVKLVHSFKLYVLK